MEQELEKRIAALAARVGSLELLVETLLGSEIARSARFRTALDELYPRDGITGHLDRAEDEAQRKRLVMIETYLSDRLREGRRQSSSFA
ncbi:MAG: hypothetical protein M9955_13240 [Rhizobiaceae bacterium]|nr:hypothetical protein [Rhizobiaceae bacterium]